MTCPYKEILSFFGHCHVTFPYMEPLSFCGRFAKVSCFSDSFVQKTTQQKGASADGSCNVTTDSQLLYKLFRKQPLYFCKIYEKYIVSKEYCIAHHDDKMCFLPNCRYHINLLGNIKELLQKLDAFCSNYQHLDCLYTLFKYHFSDKIVLKSEQVFDSLKRAVHFNQQNTGVNRMPSIAKKRLLRKKFKKYLLSSFQKTKSTQTSISVFADRIEQVKKTKFEIELIKIVDCFLDGQGNYTSNLVSFKKNLCKLTIL